MGEGRNPRDSMESTWRTDSSQWSLHHYMIDILNMHPTDIAREVPTFRKTDKMPYVSTIDTHKWVCCHALWPLVAHELYHWYTGRNLTSFMAASFYAAAFTINAIHQLNMMQHLGHCVGFLDGDKHQRDQVPDHSVSKSMQALVAASVLRPSMAVYLAYSDTQLPSTVISWWLPLEVGLYGLILDFYFYWYHRSMHEVGWLWRFHRTHHLTKHPNPLLALYADGVQDAFDIALVPLVTWATMRFCCGFPMGFFDWWICHEYISFAELWGHSGLRVYFTAPIGVPPLLGLWDAELCTEDHDLHHRQGWKKSGNYGKQTLFWDRMFGTALERIESIPSNIDWSKRAVIPLIHRPRL